MRLQLFVDAQPQGQIFDRRGRLDLPPLTVLAESPFVGHGFARSSLGLGESTCGIGQPCQMQVSCPIGLESAGCEIWPLFAGRGVAVLAGLSGLEPA